MSGFGGDYHWNITDPEEAAVERKNVELEVLKSKKRSTSGMIFISPLPFVSSAESFGSPVKYNFTAAGEIIFHVLLIGK